MEHTSRMSFRCRSQSGMTLIETVIAFGVLTAAILGPVPLVAFSMGQTQASQNKLIATNLGQEGIELLRAIRENNVICDTPEGTVAWNADPAGGQPLGEAPNNFFIVDATTKTSASCGSPTAFQTPLPTPVDQTTCTTKPLNLDADGTYTYAPGGTATPFRRCIVICVPSSAAPCNGTADGDVDALGKDGKPNQMEVVSKVFWTESVVPKSIEFRERLYNWR